MVDFPKSFLYKSVFLLIGISASAYKSHNTIYATSHTITHIWFRLFRFRSPLLSESHRFLFLRLIRCFSSPAYPCSAVLYLSITVFPIRISGGQRICAPNPGISLLITSFIGSLPQVIHHKPFVAL